MGKVIFIIIGLTIILSFSNRDCGKSRLGVKTLTDTSVKYIDFTPRRSEVMDLINLPKPKKISNNQPRLPEECITYQVNCRILEFKKEDDGDYHLIIQDISDSCQTMVAEIVDPKCDTVKTSKYFKHFLFVREAFETCTLSNGKVKRGIYKMVGVAFFDKLHGAEGAAPNGIELHPLIYFSKFK
jgi:hypothetical protein